MDKTLLEELEHYLQQKLVSIAGKNGAVAYGVKIGESIGTETIPSIKEYERSYFPDDIKGVAIETHIIDTDENKLRINVNLNIQKDLSSIEITTNLDSARENALAISEEIIRRLSNQKTHNYLFEKTSIYYFINTLIFAISLGALVQGIIFKTTILQAIGGSVAWITIGWFFLVRLKPYCTFQTHLNERREKRINFLISGIIGFILFTVVGTYFRQKYLGF